MPLKPIELRPRPRAALSTTCARERNAIKRPYIAALLHALQLSDVKEMFDQMKDHA